MHVHVHCADGEAKFWMGPQISLARNYGLSDSQIAELTDVIEEHRDEIENAWERHYAWN